MRLYGWAGLILLAVAEYCLSLKVEPFYSWFYCFAWWSYILLADNLLLIACGRSLLTSRRSELPSMLPLSVFVWLLFEACNLVTRNWSYVGVPANLWIRWSGYAAAFTSVLPGIFITSDLAEFLIFGKAESSASEAERLLVPPPGRPSAALILTGALMCGAPFIWPRYFYPAVWIGPIFVLDPLLERFHVRSLSISISSGRRRRIWSLLIGGSLCGIMWEFWNFGAGSKWVYSVPFLGSWKVFEMPALGFLGFPPFALECWILYHLLQAVRRRLASPALATAFWACLCGFSAAVFRAMDSHSVAGFAGLISRRILR
jgi:hypothetical protein